MAVADASTGEMIYALNPDQLFVPGSVTKLFSGAAALATFGPDHRFVTPLHRRGEVDSAGILRGDLILRATGDPDLSGRTNASGGLDFTNHDHTYADLYVSQGSSAELTKTDPLDGIDDLARQVAAAGIRQVADVLIDERLFQRHESGGSPPSRSHRWW
jgi:D-alanyl-D-alanine carboxypeptidase/D-alanyl-D-alanine-endopeptidase (penicillin-binding protein 4)